MDGGKPEISDIWLNKSPLGFEIMLDWDNDRHHASIVEPPYGAEQVHRAFVRLLGIISNDSHLADG